MTLSAEACDKSFAKYADRQLHELTLEGFSAFLMSADNAAMKDESEQDMTRPLSEYYISSSHNVSTPVRTQQTTRLMNETGDAVDLSRGRAAAG